MTESAARTEILRRLRAAVGPHPVAEPVPRDYHGPGGVLVDDPVALLADRLRDYRAGVRICPVAEVARAVREVLAGWESTDVIAPAGVPDEWLPPWVTVDDDASVERLDSCDAVITTCAVAVATTGTIVLDHADAGQGPRRLSLVPDRHLILVREEQIVAAVPDAIVRLDPTVPLTWVSGPSATSDIELDRVEGVHGPRMLEVVIATVD